VIPLSADDDDEQIEIRRTSVRWHGQSRRLLREVAARNEKKKNQPATPAPATWAELDSRTEFIYAHEGTGRASGNRATAAPPEEIQSSDVRLVEGRVGSDKGAVRGGGRTR